MLPEAVDDLRATLTRNSFSARCLVFEDFGIMWPKPDNLAISFYSVLGKYYSVLENITLY